MVTNVNKSASLAQNITAQTKKALMAADPQAWGMAKKGLMTTAEDFSFVPTLAAGTTLNLTTPIPETKAGKPDPLPKNAVLSAQTKKAIMMSDPQTWATVKKGLVPEGKDLSFIPAPENSQEAQYAFRQASHAYTSSRSANAPDLTDIEGLLD